MITNYQRVVCSLFTPASRFGRLLTKPVFAFYPKRTKVTSRSCASSRMIHVPLESVWSEFTPLAIRMNAVNLGQGFPDFPPEDFVTKSTIDAIANGVVQYTRTMGHPRLVKILAETYQPLIGQNNIIDPMLNVVVTPGAQGAIFAACQAFVDPGDEVILIEPFYDCYPLCVKTAGGTPVYVPLREKRKNRGGEISCPRDWVLDTEELKRSITPKTKMVILNTPQNCPGKVYSLEELSQICKVIVQKDLILVCDGVYEWIVYDGIKYTYPASLPGMWERTVTIGSAGKSFSVTGYKIGWAIGPNALVSEICKIIQLIPFCVSTPLQEGVAVSFERVKSNNYWEQLKTMFQNKRDKLVTILNDCGLKPVVPEGSYFIFASTKTVPEKCFLKHNNTTKDHQFCRWLTEEIGVTAIPPSAFYSPENKEIAENFARFTFCKRDEVIMEGAKRLAKLNLLS